MNSKPIFSLPKRIQRKRTKGWRMPPNTVYVGRPTKFGNYRDWRKFGRAEAVRLYRAMLDVQPSLCAEAKRELAGKNLACWCPLDEPCHADVLLGIANSTL
jgi:Domain of unknown function (DUF4326)